jgi:hypothetical protein
MLPRIDDNLAQQEYPRGPAAIEKFMALGDGIIVAVAAIRALVAML